MSLDAFGWGKISDLLGSVINRAWPDPQQQAQAQLALLQLEQSGQFKEIDAQLEMMKAQTDINLADANSGKFFQSGARPAILWTCALGFFYQLIFCPLASWLAVAGYGLPELPPIDASTLETTMWALLGIGGMRSYDRTLPHLPKIMKK